MKKLVEMWYQLSYTTRSNVEGVALFLGTILGAVLLATGIILLVSHSTHGALNERCYDDQTCDDALVCTMCKDGCAVTFTCLPK